MQIPMGPEQCGAGGSLGLFLLADPSPAVFFIHSGTWKAGQGLAQGGGGLVECRRLSLW